MKKFAAIRKNIKKGKNCPIKYCHKCLLTRYGENAEEVAQLANWTCQKCRGICNCSFCHGVSFRFSIYFLSWYCIHKFILIKELCL
ncbi:hypothetical protein VIGAN_11119600 [Vigna angularis var. angularis]|uniref:Zinc-finger domain-containing protein n=1 Tax=Vigna angularis var. angularis TaxID=157739 RepID=A0A0S3TA21_PHAAN|nr:hypothetical protein VIGAN_11119600 [Vigna angularis var. angularis]